MAYEIFMRGLVQGVGFRPFIYHLANRLDIKGDVSNANYGVVIRCDCSVTVLDIFLDTIQNEIPKVASVHDITVQRINLTHPFDSFTITPSQSVSNRTTQVAPDIAVCDECLSDRKMQPHRIAYPFVNCTHCGPRFSIIRDLPYDRAQTSMSDFRMCQTCNAEYNDISDRRFHAEPIACNHCGPKYYCGKPNEDLSNYREILNVSSELINRGEVIAVRGLGGYHLVCNANDEKAVLKLRRVKLRDNKPFAVMFKNIETLCEYAEMNECEKVYIVSWRRPIVLLRQKHSLAYSINEGLRTLGCMLPYLPIHYDWFEQTGLDALVMTSGNISECPIVISPNEAESVFGNKASLIIHHNRDIVNRVDDSIVQSIRNKPCVIRRSRGFVPEPLFTDIHTEGILAFGAEKVNTFALGKEDMIIQSQYIGDLKNNETFVFYEEALNRFVRLFRFTANSLVCDLHPDYLSSQFAEKMAHEGSLPLIAVQHHHAHAVSCMMDNRLDEEVIAVVWDGIGLGDDRMAWGGEFFVCDRTKYKRLDHLPYIPMPGGDKASHEPWRMALSYLMAYGLDIPASFEQRIGEEKIGQMQRIIQKRMNCPETSSAGRLFDALSSILGICDYASYQAEAPSLLEQSASDDCEEMYDIGKGENLQQQIKCLLAGVLDDMVESLPVTSISLKIHCTLAAIIYHKVQHISLATRLKKVVLSGGCFQNKRLTEQIIRFFENDTLYLYIHTNIPCNDSGIAVGQLAIAAATRKNGDYA